MFHSFINSNTDIFSLEIASFISRPIVPYLTYLEVALHMDIWAFANRARIYTVVSYTMLFGQLPIPSEIAGLSNIVILGVALLEVVDLPQFGVAKDAAYTRGSVVGLGIFLVQWIDSAFSCCAGSYAWPHPSYPAMLLYPAAI